MHNNQPRLSSQVKKAEKQPKATLIFLHGNSQNNTVWKKLWESNVFKNYNLKFLELPGHGDSPRLENYTIEHLVNVLAYQLNEENKRYLLIGHSLGGHLCIEALPQLKNYLGLILVGTPPLQKPLNMQEAFKSDPRMSLLFKEYLDSQEVIEMANFLTNTHNLDSVIQMIVETDAKFRNGIGESASKNNLLDEVKILEQTALPFLFVLGENDAIVKKEYIESLIEGTKFSEGIKYIKKAGHSPQLENPEDFEKVILKFVGKISST